MKFLHAFQIVFALPLLLKLGQLTKHDLEIYKHSHGTVIIYVQQHVLWIMKLLQKTIWPPSSILKKGRVWRDKYAKSSFLNLEGVERAHTNFANTLFLIPSGQTLLAMELIIHNRCSEMFSRIYVGAQKNSQVSL